MSKSLIFHTFEINKIPTLILGDTIYHVMASWENWVYWLQSDKGHPTTKELSELKKEMQRCGNNYWLYDSSSTTCGDATEPRYTFVGISSRSAFYQYYQWLLGYYKIEFPSEYTSYIAKEEALNLLGKNKASKRPKELELPSFICSHSWSFLDYNKAKPKNLQDHNCYRRITAAYAIIKPTGVIAMEQDPLNCVGIRCTGKQAPEILVRGIFAEWGKYLDKKI